MALANKLHWKLDISFSEDACTAKKDTIPAISLADLSGGGGDTNPRQQRPADSDGRKNDSQGQLM